MRMKTLDYVNIITYAEDLKMSDVSFLNTLLSISRKLAVGCSEQALDKSVAKAMAINTEDGDIFDCHELLAELAANGILETFYVERHFLGKIDNVRHFKLSEHGREFLTFAEKINS